MNIFSTRLKKVLDDKNWKQADLVRSTGISKSMISDYINGNFEPKEENLVLLSNSLGVSKEWLSGLNEEYILNNATPHVLANMLVELLQSAIIDKKITNEKLASKSRLDIDMIAAVLQKKHQYIDYKYLRLVFALEMQDDKMINSFYYKNLPKTNDYANIIGTVYKEFRKKSNQNFVDSSGIYNREFTIMIENDPLSLDKIRVDNYLLYLGINFSRDVIENMVHYYYFIPDFFSMGYSTFPLEDLHLYLVDKDNLSIEEYISTCVDKILAISRTNKYFDLFSESIFEIAQTLTYDRQQHFYKELLSFAKYTAKREK